MFKLALSFAALSFLFASPATAADKLSDKWIVTQLSGDARVVHPGARPASLSVNNQLAPGDTLLTGPTGRATLVRGGDYIVIAPRSELRLPATPQPTGFTRVIQNLGTLLFKVQHTGIPHFAVDTPMLAAVVKGTTFTVVVDQNRSAVQVIQGAVQVTAITGGMREIVEGGRTVFVNHDNPKLLLDADKPAPTTPTRSSTSVTISAAGDAPLATIASLTGGLVRAEVTASTTPAATTPPIVQAVVASNSVTPTSTPNDSSSTPAPGAGSATATPAVTTSTPVVTAPSSSTAPVTTPVTTAPAATTPSITVSSVTVAAVTTPTVSTGSNSGPSSNSGPGSLSSGSGSSNSGPGSLSSGSGSSNSGPGSTSSGSGSISTSTVTAPTVTTSPVSTPIATVSSVSIPTTTVPSVTAPTVTDLSVSTPTLTVPSISTPTVSTPLVTIPTVTTPTVTVPTINVPLLKL
jgi:hypothetical protein